MPGAWHGVLHVSGGEGRAQRVPRGAIANLLTPAEWALSGREGGKSTGRWVAAASDLPPLSHSAPPSRLRQLCKLQTPGIEPFCLKFRLGFFIRQLGINLTGLCQEGHQAEQLTHLERRPARRERPYMFGVTGTP